MNNMKVLIGMSGGVDSSVAALLLKKQGYDVLGATLLLTQDDDGASAKDAKEVCDAIGIPHITADLRESFRKHVTEYFVSEYQKGRTPNPCVVCNKTIKFGEMMRLAEANGCDTLATGHYAKVEKQENGLHVLKKAICTEKDQTYFLYTLPQEVLSRILMPLGTYNKEEIRNMAEAFGLSVARKKDSQDICFIPDGDKNAYLLQYLSETPGDFLDTNGNVIGKHKGAFQYTIGQRKGLGMGFGKPMFVLSVNTQDNTVTLGEAGQEFTKEFDIEDCCFSAFKTEPESLECFCKARYSAKESPCCIQKQENGYHVVLKEPARAITPGQACVFYQGDTLLGGGTITKNY